MAQRKMGPEIRSWRLFSNEPSLGHPSSQERNPTTVIPNPNSMIKTEPERARIFFGRSNVSDNPKELIIMPEGMKPIQFIRSALGVPVAPNSLIKS